MSDRELEYDRDETVPFPPAAGFWRRLTAWALDLVWIGPALWFSARALESVIPAVWARVVVVVALLLTLAGMWWVWGATPGKGILGLRILGADGLPVRGRQVGLRCLGCLLNLLTLGLGFAMVGLHASRRGLHDRLSETYVAEVRRGRGVARRPRRRRRRPRRHDDPLDS